MAMMQGKASVNGFDSKAKQVSMAMKQGKNCFNADKARINITNRLLYV